jgi:hypothetical protein
MGAHPYPHPRALFEPVCLHDMLISYTPGAGFLPEDAGLGDVPEDPLPVALRQRLLLHCVVAQGLWHQHGGGHEAHGESTARLTDLSVVTLLMSLGRPTYRYLMPPTAHASCTSL